MSDTLDLAVTRQSTANPLLKPWTTPFETPPFAEIAPAHFMPAFEQAFFDHAAEIAAIVNDNSAPDFANTIIALERSGKLLSRVAAVFYDLVSAHSNPELLAIDTEVSLRMARHWNPIMMNAVLFGRIAQLHDNRAGLGLTPEQLRLLERTYNRFHRSGAGLDDAAKARMAEINERLASLGTSFSHHLLADEQDWFMEIGEDDTAGLPASFVAAAKAAAGLPSRGWPTAPITASQRRWARRGMEVSEFGENFVTLPITGRQNRAGMWMWPQKLTWAGLAARLRAASAVSLT